MRWVMGFFAFRSRAWRAFARALVRAARRPNLRMRDTCVLISNSCANDTPRMKSFDRIAYAIAYQKAHAKEISERRRRRRKADPAYRQKLIAVAHAYYEANKEELTERRRGARNERHAGRTCLSFSCPVGLRAMRARAMGNAHKISAAAGERTSHPASAETEPSSGSCLKHTLPA